LCRSSKTIANDVANVILDATILVSAFLTPQGVRDERLRHGWRGAFVLCLSEKILEETGRVLLAFQEHRSESEVDDALEPLLSNEPSS
jgi:predicted nucleic acid-binding protein